MLDALITSKTRIKLLLKFFLNSNYSSYLRNLESEFGESSNAVRVELNRFEKAGLLTSSFEGNRKYYRANTRHPLYSDIHNLILKYVGIDKILDNVVSKLGDLDRVYLTGTFARGMDNGPIELAFVGIDINEEYLTRLVTKAEGLIKHKISCSVLQPADAAVIFASPGNGDALLLWTNGH